MDYNKEYQRWTDCKDLDPSLKAELLRCILYES